MKCGMSDKQVLNIKLSRAPVSLGFNFRRLICRSERQRNLRPSINKLILDYTSGLRLHFLLLCLLPEESLPSRCVWDGSDCGIFLNLVEIRRAGRRRGREGAQLFFAWPYLPLQLLLNRRCKSSIPDSDGICRRALDVPAEEGRCQPGTAPARATCSSLRIV